MAFVGWILALLIGIVLALFAVGNQQAASINLFGANYGELPTWVVMVGSAALGALMVVMISLVDRFRWFVSSRQHHKVLTEHKKMLVQRDNRIHELEQELMRLRGAA
jgi:uncharacterized integral membrane protein